MPAAAFERAGPELEPDSHPAPDSAPDSGCDPPGDPAVGGIGEAAAAGTGDRSDHWADHWADDPHDELAAAPQDAPSDHRADHLPDDPADETARELAGDPQLVEAGGRLAGIARDLDARFNETSECLCAAVDAIERIVAALQAVAGMFEQGEAAGAVNDLTEAAQRLSGVSAQAARRGGEADAIRQASRHLARSVSEVQRALRVLQIYGMNVKIAASGAEAFVDFANRMGEKLKIGEEEAKGFAARLADLASSMDCMLHNDALLEAECRKVLPQVPDRLIGDAEALRGHQAGLVRLAQATGTLARSIQGELGAALGAIQVGDRARQRLEHVVTGARLLEAAQAAGTLPGAGARQHVRRLLAALALEASDEYRRDAAALALALHALRKDAEGLIALRASSAGEGGDGAVFLHRLEQGIADAAGMVDQLQRADAQAEATLEVIALTVSDVTARVKTIRELSLDVRQMAINIGLRCRKVEVIGRPVNVIAAEIRSQSDQFDAVIREIDRAEGMLGEVSVRMRMQAEGEVGGGLGLTRSLAAIHDCADRTETAMTDIGRRSHGVTGMLERASALLDEAIAIGETIGDAAMQLAPCGGENGVSPWGDGDGVSPCGDGVGDGDGGAAPGEEAALRELLIAIGRSYTMADERLVHDGFLLPGMTPLAAPAGATVLSGAGSGNGGSCDDGLFDDGLFDDGLFDDGLF